jgi:AcrR family transcriptional regulator
MSRSRKPRAEPRADDRRCISDARRIQILEAAVDVIADRGLADTRISDIAERTGTSSALIVYYFGSKDRLLADALTFSEERFYAMTAEELRAIPTATGQLRRLIELSCSADGAKATGVGEWVLWLDMWSRAYRDPDVARDREVLDRRWRDTIADIVRRGVAEGEFDDIDPEDFALRLASLVDGLAIQVVLKDRDVTAARMLQVCLGMAENELGLAAPAKARATAGGGRRGR